MSVRIIDGAHGTYLQEHPEKTSLDLYIEYSGAGCDIITSDTFVVPSVRLTPEQIETFEYELDLAEGSLSSVFVSLGPTDLSLSFGGDYHVLYDNYLILCKLAKRHSMRVLFETFQDSLNVKVALAAAYKAGVKAYLSVSPDATGHLLDGSSLRAVHDICLSYENVCGFGINCGDSMQASADNLRELNKWSAFPILFYPNAGDYGHYLSPVEWSDKVYSLIKDLGVNYIGGCCGTTPEHIWQLTRYKFIEYKPKPRQFSVSGLESMPLCNDLFKIGERCNVAGSKKFLTAVLDKDYDQVLDIAIAQVAAGASALDINLDYFSMSFEDKLMVIRVLSSNPVVAKVPFVLDTAYPDFAKEVLPYIHGRCIINSISANDSDDWFDLCKVWGAVPIIRAQLYAGGFGSSTDDKKNIFLTAVESCEKHGIKDWFYDTCITPICLDENSDKLIRQFRTVSNFVHRHKVPTCLGISNVSYAFKGNNTFRAYLNSVFTKFLKADSVICDVSKIASEVPAEIEEALESQYPTNWFITNSHKYQTGEVKRVVKEATNLQEALLLGSSSQAKNFLPDEPTSELLSALQELSKLYDSNDIQLVQLLSAASTVKKLLPERKLSLGISIILCTVKGDIHSIGKDILAEILSSHGIDVIDLGVDVYPEAIYQAYLSHNAKTIGLSGLISPSLDSMRETIKYFDDHGVVTKFILGGAAVNEEFVKSIQSKSVVLLSKTPSETYHNCL